MTAANKKITDARAEMAYFEDVIYYMNKKLAVFQLMEQALNPNEIHDQEGNDWEFYQTIQPEKNMLWDMLYDLNNQLEEIQTTVAEFEFEQFVLQSRFANEDQYAAEMDLERQQGWLDDAQTILDELTGERDGYVTIDF